MKSLIFVMLLMTSFSTFAFMRGGGGMARGAAPMNINHNVNVNRNVNVNVHGGGGWGGYYHPVATAAVVTAAAVTTAAVIGSVVHSIPPSCSTTVMGGVAYQQCGSTWYRPQYVGSNVQYTVVTAPI
jgi:hypothetical protein